MKFSKIEIEEMKRKNPELTEPEAKKKLAYAAQRRELDEKEKILDQKVLERKKSRKNDDIKRMGKALYNELGSGMNKYEIKGFLERIKKSMNFPEILPELEKEGRAYFDK